MDHPQDIPRRELSNSMVVCIHCDHWYESEGWKEGTSFTPTDPCDNCGREQE